MKKTIKRALRSALLSPLGAPLGSFYRGIATCLMYHHLGDDDSPNRELYVSVAEFERQMAHLAAHYEPLSIGDAIARFRENRLHPRNVIVTFDDGYRDNLLALPILKRYNVPATIYVTTGAVNRTRTFWWDELATLAAREQFPSLAARMKTLKPREQDAWLAELRAGRGPTSAFDAILTWEEVAALDAEPLITIGAHTIDHYPLAQLDEDELHRQLIRSREELESRLGHPVEHFAYPFGRPEHAAEREFAAAEAAGFASAVTTRPGHWQRDSSLYALPRLAVDYSDTLDDFRWKLSGFAAVLQNRAA